MPTQPASRSLRCLMGADARVARARQAKAGVDVSAMLGGGFMETHDVDLAAVLALLAIALFKEESLTTDLETLVRVACRVLADCSGASVALLVDGEPTTVAVDDRVTLEIDLLQYEKREGPCITALGGQQIRVGYVPADERFPHFAVGAADRRVLSVLSTPILERGTVLGTVNLYSDRPDAFGQEAQDIARVISAEAATAVRKSKFLTTARAAREQLQERYDESVQTSRAQGALMVMYDCSAEQALDLLRNAAETNRERLLLTAERILSSMQEEPAGLSDAGEE
jgi:GAF domain-containing protein